MLTTTVDNPIRDPSQDLLGREPLAASFARRVHALDAQEGVVVGVYGSWGSGKTSFLNLAKNAFEELGIDVLEFNPWFFGGTDELLNRFFGDLSSKMYRRKHLKELARDFAKYGLSVGMPTTSLSGMPWLCMLFMVLSFAFKRTFSSQSLHDMRTNIVKDLSRREQPLIVMIDDIDRLTKSETLAVFKLIRLIGRFPNLIYIVACDRDQVEKSLDCDADAPSGRNYMEKIIQYPINLPEMSSREIFNLIDKRIKKIIKSADSHRGTRITVDRWPDIRNNIVFPLFKNMRDVNRFLAVVPAVVDDLKETVTAVDVVALEAIRMFLPDTFAILPGVIDVITFDSGDRDQDPAIHEGEDFVLHADFGWGRDSRGHEEYQKLELAKILDVLILESSGTSNIQEQRQSPYKEHMVNRALMKHVFRPAVGSISGEKDEGLPRDILHDWNHIYIRHVFEKYLARRG